MNIAFLLIALKMHICYYIERYFLLNGGDAAFVIYDEEDRDIGEGGERRCKQG